MTDVKDGLSNTWMIGETLPAECIHNMAFGSNFPMAGTSIPLNVRATPSQMPQPGMSNGQLHATNPHARLCGFKSSHVGGAFFVLGDASVHFISQTIDYRLYNELGTRNGSESVALPE